MQAGGVIVSGEARNAEKCVAGEVGYTCRLAFGETGFDMPVYDTLRGGLGTDWFWSPNTTGILADTLDKTVVERRRTV